MVKYVVVISAISGFLLGFAVPIMLGGYVKLKEGKFVTFLGLRPHLDGSDLERKLSQFAVKCYRVSLFCGLIFVCSWFYSQL